MAEPLPTRELLERAVIRIRRDLATVHQLAEIVGINTPVPDEVAHALEVLGDWTAELLAAGRPRHRDLDPGPVRGPARHGPAAIP